MLPSNCQFVFRCILSFVAEYMLERLKAVPESKWNETSASRDYTHNNIRCGCSLHCLEGMLKST